MDGKYFKVVLLSVVLSFFCFNELKAQKAPCFPITMPDSSEFPKADNRQVLVLSDSLAAANLKFKYATGYRVRLYSGASRDEANNAKKVIYIKEKEVEVYTNYQQPNFIVTAGDFTSKLEVHYFWKKMLKYFPDALIVPAKVNLRRTS
jgi:hypothetical protein